MGTQTGENSVMSKYSKSTYSRHRALRIDHFCSRTPLDLVTFLLRMPIRELSSVTPKSTTLVTAICRLLKTVGRDDFSRYFEYFWRSLRGEQVVLVSRKQMVLPTVNHFHHVVCYDGKLRNRPCKIKNQISISVRIGIAASARQVHKCLPSKNETRPCIRLLFSRLNEFFS